MINSITPTSYDIEVSQYQDGDGISFNMYDSGTGATMNVNVSMSAALSLYAKLGSLLPQQEAEIPTLMTVDTGAVDIAVEPIVQAQ